MNPTFNKPNNTTYNTFEFAINISLLPVNSELTKEEIDKQWEDYLAKFYDCVKNLYSHIKPFNDKNNRQLVDLSILAKHLMELRNDNKHHIVPALVDKDVNFCIMGTVIAVEYSDMIYAIPFIVYKNVNEAKRIVSSLPQ